MLVNTTTLLFDLAPKCSNDIFVSAFSGRDGELHRNLDLPYTKAAIHEIFRIRTVVPLSIARTTVEDAYVQGYVIPKGTQVISLSE